MTNLYLPQHIRINDPVEVGRTEEGEGKMAVSLKAEWSCPRCGETHEITATSLEGAAFRNQLEDNIGAGIEKAWKEHMVQHELRGSRLTPRLVGQNRDVRRHVAEALKDYKKTKARMKASSNGQIHWVVPG